MRKEQYIKRILLQKVIGVVFILLCVFIVKMAVTAPIPEDRDITTIFIFAPLGLYLIFTKNIVFY